MYTYLIYNFLKSVLFSKSILPKKNVCKEVNGMGKPY